MWRFFRRRRSPKFRPFDRRALPEVEPLSFEETFADGLLVAEAAGRMAMKNRIILMALRGEEPLHLHGAVHRPFVGRQPGQRVAGNA